MTVEQQQPLTTATALYDFTADDASQISFKAGDVITVHQMEDSGWWSGANPEGDVGWFPASYVEATQPTSDSSVKELSNSSYHIAIECLGKVHHGRRSRLLR